MGGRRRTGWRRCCCAIVPAALIFLTPPRLYPPRTRSSVSSTARHHHHSRCAAEVAPSGLEAAAPFFGRTSPSLSRSSGARVAEAAREAQVSDWPSKFHFHRRLLAPSQPDGP